MRDISRECIIKFFNNFRHIKVFNRIISREVKETDSLPQEERGHMSGTSVTYGQWFFRGL